MRRALTRSSRARDDAADELAALAGIGPVAAAACLQAADADPGNAEGLRSLAVELSEKGRRVLFAQVLDSGTDIADLAAAYPALAAAFTDLAAEFDRPESTDPQVLVGAGQLGFGVRTPSAAAGLPTNSTRFWRRSVSTALAASVALRQGQ